ncbi:type IA DNA topoisomerase [Bifidobacterium eulemuris]|uniref:DNA topoisomerase n=1 Tax=Bifidobacterium eulemuris TaxID=1765219 RepID=A0A261GC48_9BIFI|nr:type IA DNA topoisomerase [Bifidobacterium eulemuris]OZG69009.1 DNA topoisomerase III [Bifidobacterium eulemuris]QOL31462.1 topoisomerase C-terminal repeat-containing protein [Bifidobacterium eulemuris]
MRLVIAEKKSVAVAIAQALESSPIPSDGYIQAGDVIVSWAQGHLVELATPDQYDGMPWAAERWSMEQLPIDPQQWLWQVSTDKGASRRYRDLADLIRRPDITEIVNACDPDREGEAIFRRIIDRAQTAKPSSRLWVASLEEQAIRDAWNNMLPSSQYNGLAAAADARAKADWLVGMNATRANTIAYHRRLSVGRVQTPTLAMVVERDRAIAEHKPTPFWRIAIDMGGWKLRSKDKINIRSEAESLLAEAQGRSVNMLSVERKRVKTHAPTLYDLTGLQKDMSRLHGLTAAQTLEALERLYLAKLTTYPRTDSCHITHDDLAELEALTRSESLDELMPVTVAEAVREYRNTDRLNPSACVADDKVSGHTAILPTKRLTQASLASMGEHERLVACRIVQRMWAACSPEYTHDTTSVTACFDHITEHLLTASSDMPVDPGWRLIDGPQTDEQAAPSIPSSLMEGQSIPVGAHAISLEEGVSAPPKPYTEATLLAAMEHASRFVADKDMKAALDDDASHSGGIGTPATRAEIIEKLVRNQYLQRKGKQLVSTDEGRLLIDVVSPELKSVELTASMEAQLSDIEHGRIQSAVFLDGIRAMCARIPHDVQASMRTESISTGPRRASLGACPRCGEDVIKTGSVWQCSSNKSEKTESGQWQQAGGCGFKIYSTLSGKKLTDSVIGKLLAGKAVKLSGFVSKRTGKAFAATLVIDEERGVRMQFD